MNKINKKERTNRKEKLKLAVLEPLNKIIKFFNKNYKVF